MTLSLLWQIGASPENNLHENQIARREPPWEAPLDVPESARASLTQSIREFQLGDGGGPASLIAFNADSFRGSCDNIRKLVDSWFNEEKEHSRLLGEVVKRLESTEIATHWSFELFCFFRRTLGVAFELQILTVTELVSTSYYTLLRKYCSDPAIKAVCSLILRDETGHVRFHNDRLAAMGRARRGIRGRLWALQFRWSGYFAATVLWLSHGRCIRQLGGSNAEFTASVNRQIGGFLSQLDAKTARASVEALPVS